MAQEREEGQANGGALSISGKAGGSSLDVASVAAALRSLDGLSVAKRPLEVKNAFQSIRDTLEAMQRGEAVPGGKEPLSAKNFVSSMELLGFKRPEREAGKEKESRDSVYLTIPVDTTVRASNHPATISFLYDDKTPNNFSIVIRKPGDYKKFVDDSRVNAVEAVFAKGQIRDNPDKLPHILRDVAEFLATGEYHDTAGALKYNYSGSEAFKSAAEERLYEDSMARGDWSNAAKIVKDRISRLGGRMTLLRDSDGEHSYAVFEGDRIPGGVLGISLMHGIPYQLPANANNLVYHG